MGLDTWEFIDFKAYLFIYCTFADHLQVEKERKLAIKKVGELKFKKMHEEIEKDTDDVSINKIRRYVKKHNINKEAAKKLLLDVKDMFLSDGEFHKLERRLYNSLERIFGKELSKT